MLSHPSNIVKGYMFLLEWTTDEGEKGFNTYLTGYPAYDLATYKAWFSKIEVQKALLG